jgi:hypothetical protein
MDRRGASPRTSLRSISSRRRPLVSPYATRSTLGAKRPPARWMRPWPEVIGGTCGGHEVAVGDAVLYAMRRCAEHPGRVGDADLLVGRDRPDATAVRPSPVPRPSPSGRPGHLGTSHRLAAPAPRGPDGRQVIVWDLDRHTTPVSATRPASATSGQAAATTDRRRFRGPSIGRSGRALARAWCTVPRSRTTILEEHDGPPLNRRARVR